MNKHFDVVELVYRKIITKNNKKEQQKQYNNNKKERNIESRKSTIVIENIKTTFVIFNTPHSRDKIYRNLYTNYFNYC